MPLEFIFTADDFYVDQADNSNITGWQKRFVDNKLLALYELGFDKTVKSDSQSFIFLHFLATKFVEFLTSVPEIELTHERLETLIPDETKNAILNSIPFALGAEFVNRQWLDKILARLVAIFNHEISNYNGTVTQYISGKSKVLKLPERIFFHIAENKTDLNYPFAFLVTYATSDEDMRVQHMPLSYALNEFKNDRPKLLALLSCLNKAANVSPLISSFIDSGELFHPLRLSSKEAYDILKSTPALENSGIICRIPDWWKKRSSSVRLSVKFNQKSSMLGFDTILSMNVALSVNGINLTPEDVKAILQQTEGLALIKGKWVEVDKERLQRLLDKMNRYDKDVTLLDALKLEAGLNDFDNDEVEFTNEDFVANTLGKICNTTTFTTQKTLPRTVKATLRPYQRSGYSWLCMMSELKLGACLADDMGLGKTLQVLTFLEELRQQHKNAKILLIVPASLLDNWEKEASRFTPRMPLNILHGRNRDILERELTHNDLAFLNITTYATATRLEGLQKREWDVIILDEAQAIKNATTLQAKLIKRIPAQHRIAMTGTPVENNLSNLWSLFDFLNKGLLGTPEEFKRFSASINDKPQSYLKLKNIVSPFILRRLKTDKAIISDLPDKIEQIDYVSLSKKQIILYRNQVKEIERVMTTAENLSTIKRNGMILSTITRLKQICNHPDQFLGQGMYMPSESGKFEMLREICDTIHEKREKVLVFTQFREIINSLEHYLSEIFHAKGLVIHGETPVRKRADIVDSFNKNKQNQFMILSLKSAGVGLNLTGANHVIHFDRWWNPAVENQATDRAFRIGQIKNVIIHKFVTKGTIEERINDIIESKRSLAENVISSGENWLTDLSNNEIISMMKLDNE